MLRLPIRRWWFYMILAGEKREEYRIVKPYWKIRIGNERLRAERCNGELLVEFVAGYGVDAPKAVFEIASMVERMGRPSHPEWGEPADLHFVLRLGRCRSYSHQDRASGGRKTIRFSCPAKPTAT